MTVHITQDVRQAPLHVRWSLPFVGATLVGITLLHYLTSAHLLPYHSIYRSLYYLPIGVAAVTWGVRGGLLASLFVTLVHLPYVFLMGNTMPGGILDNLLEVLAFNAVAALTGSLADAQRQQRQRAETLRAYIDDVLASLPVGVATTDGEQLMPQNPAARELLRALRDPRQLPAQWGYHEITLAERPVGLRRSSLHGADGDPVGQVLVLEDLSEQQRLHQQVRQAERLAALGRLAGGLAHEVRNPLGIVRATAQLLAAKLQDQANLRRYTDVLTHEADRIERLIGELLAYATPRVPQPAPLDAVAFAEELAGSFSPYAEQHGVQLRVSADPVRLAVCADREQLRQAVLNLLLNAVQASSPGQIVELRCAATAGHVCFGVRDHGGGIPLEIRGRIFDPFWTTRDDGTGMGLAVVARIVADHGGSVEVEDAPGGGALVTLCLRRSSEEPWPNAC